MGTVTAVLLIVAIVFVGLKKLFRGKEQFLPAYLQLMAIYIGGILGLRMIVWATGTFAYKFLPGSVATFIMVFLMFAIVIGAVWFFLWDHRRCARIKRDEEFIIAMALEKAKEITPTEEELNLVNQLQVPGYSACNLSGDLLRKKWETWKFLQLVDDPEFRKRIFDAIEQHGRYPYGKI